MTNEEFNKQNTRVERAKELQKMIDGLKGVFDNELKNVDGFVVNTNKTHYSLTVIDGEREKTVSASNYIKSFRQKMKAFLLAMVNEQIAEYKKEFGEL